MVELVDIVSRSWGFTGLIALRVLDVNAFGNLLVEDEDGRVWRICPEELSCEVAASSSRDLEQITSSEDWKMNGLVDVATAALGRPEAGRCFCLKVPGVLGGQYAAVNIGIISIAELIAFAGDVALKIKDLPDGAKIEFKIVD
jgi:type VI secretion system (T6SS) immunity protein Tdi1